MVLQYNYWGFHFFIFTLEYGMSSRDTRKQGANLAREGGRLSITPPDQNIVLIFNL